MTPAYQLTRSAANDLKSIVQYTTMRWGKQQCRIYVAQLEDAAGQLAYGQTPFKSLDDVLPGLRVKLAGRHYIFCLPRIDRPALVLAILHDRMDLMVRLKERLGP